jgi:hypothetical protein
MNIKEEVWIFDKIHPESQWKAKKRQKNIKEISFHADIKNI